MQTWLAAQRQDRRPRSNSKTLRSMMPAYLGAVAAMPSYRDRKRDTGLWIAEFGDRSPYAVTRADVQRVLARWEVAGVAASTIRHRRSALSHFYDMATPDVENPARAAKAPAQYRGAPRAIPPELLEAIIAKMPDVGRGAKGKRRPAGSQAKARIRVMWWTGIPPKQMMLLKPEHVNLDAGQVWTQPRRKGKGTAGAMLPLLPDAIEAFRE